MNISFSTRRKWLRGAGALVAGAVLGLPTVVADVTEGSRRRLRFSITLSNPESLLLKDQRFWMYLPVGYSGGQKLLTTEVSVPHRLHNDAFGHTLLELHFDQFPPLGQKVVGLAIEIAMNSMPHPSANSGDWLGAERFIESEAPGIVALSGELRHPDPWKTGRVIFDWVARNLTYAGYLADDYGALYALNRRRGDCTEYAYLATALARACGIPARMVGGYVLDRDAAPRAEDYHNWAELYVDGGWRLLDAQKGNWLQPVDQYVAFRYHRAEMHNPLGSAHRFRVEGGLKVRM
ncbi:transglutaminase-like domain-containing protein [Azonexus sp.]|jgi:transglutaminase-like putative cysteine protease|uniref:transglutaminase-like domain-containing protein n=1 Tax=Azonexus sp. TaxID=1872668 RepID=UPI00281E3A1B|nr:transglutaminase-like domain-containing protein [Azonexus sp.]MDR1994822.1 transglutaminase-like domain-containing protein [Azonexus sp.]